MQISGNAISVCQAATTTRLAGIDRLTIEWIWIWIKVLARWRLSSEPVSGGGAPPGDDKEAERKRIIPSSWEKEILHDWWSDSSWIKQGKSLYLLLGRMLFCERIQSLRGNKCSRHIKMVDEEFYHRSALRCARVVFLPSWLVSIGAIPILLVFVHNLFISWILSAENT